MITAWDRELAALLDELSAVQDDSLEALLRKCRLLGEADTEGLAALGREEERLIARLGECLRRREELLARAAAEGMPAENLGALARALPAGRGGDLPQQVEIARAKARLLQHQSLTNWVIAQRSIIHLSQTLEILATGGRLQPTYGKDGLAATSGALVDQAG